MSTQPFPATRKTEKLINRLQELAQISDAIYEVGQGCQVVMLYGPGGLGKSRLVEEVLWRGGNRQARERRSYAPTAAEDWSKRLTQSGKTAAFGDLIDLTEPRYNTRINLMQAIRDALAGEGEILFNDYDRARADYTGLQQVGAATQIIEEAGKQVEASFIKDLQDNEARHRLTLVFDTAEKLQFGVARELLESNLLTEENLAYYSAFWLLDLIRNRTLRNTTLILVGRKKEGREFFETIQTAWAENERPAPIELTPFKAEDVSAYFRQLAQDWSRTAQADPTYEHIVDQMQWLAEDEEQCRVLWLYTGGQPVRLAMYADVLVEGYTVPKPLRKSWGEAVTQVKTEDPIHNPTPELEQVQLEIEKEFISLIFQQPGLPPRILKLLVRTPRGLHPEQLSYLLFTPQHFDPADWQPSSDEEKQIQEAIKSLLSLSIIKRRPDNRLGLQDEVYHIYARHMQVDQQNKSDEIQERHILYEKLHHWAHIQVGKFRGKKRAVQEDDERKLQIGSPAEALRVVFPDPGRLERNRRSEIDEAIRSWRLEEIHYYLLVDLTANLNHVLFDLADHRMFSVHENEDGMILNEIHRILQDAELYNFLNLKPWPALQARDEDVITALKRVMRQIEYLQWLRRFVLLKEYDAAVQYYRAIEKYIEDKFQGLDYRSFKHTLSAHERQALYLYVKLLQGNEIEATIAQLNTLITDLDQLAHAGQDEVVFKERDENGFGGHPGEARLRITLGQICNFAGYGCALLGYARQAQAFYARAIAIFREYKYSEESTVTNNLSRVLSDQGSPYARLVCLDGLMRRKELSGLDVAYAYSLNTLALIDNDSFRPDLAWVEATKALAYFRRAQDLRGEGLALLQLAEALRRLARQEYAGPTLSASPETIYEQAQIAVHRAEGIFDNELPEKIRLIEAYIEMGCVYRDLVLFYKGNPNERQANYRDALAALSTANRLAHKAGVLRYQIDAQVNIAWMHYYYGDLEQAGTTIADLQALFPPDSQITSRTPSPDPKRDDAFLFYQSGKLAALQGRIAMQYFRQCTEEIRKNNPDSTTQKRNDLAKEDEKAQASIRAGATAFTLAAGYNWLFSSRSPIVRIVEEPLYDYLKKLNHTELGWFLAYYHQAVETFELQEKVFIHRLISKCFGIGAES